MADFLNVDTVLLFFFLANRIQKKKKKNLKQVKYFSYVLLQIFWEHYGSDFLFPFYMYC